MADKKITALTEMLATGKNDAEDLLHIIDYSASPVNKKIKLVNLFSTIETPITAYGAHTHDFGPTTAISALSVVVNHVAPTTEATKAEVIVNDDGNAFIDFRVQTSLNDSAFLIDSSLDSTAGNCNTITINGGAIDALKKVDFNINSSTGVLFHTDSTDHVVGVGTTTPDTAYLLDVAAVGGKSIKAAGTIDVTGSITATGNLTVTGLLTFNDVIATALVGGVDVANDIAIPIVDLVTHLNPSVSGNTDFYDIANGAPGQIKILVNTAAPVNSAIITPANAHGGTTITLEGYETALLMYTGTLGWAVIGTQGAAVT